MVVSAEMVVTHSIDPWPGQGEGEEEFTTNPLSHGFLKAQYHTTVTLYPTGYLVTSVGR